MIKQSADGSRMYGPVRHRLAMRVEIGEACWLWTGFRNGRGYGAIGTGASGKTERVHRVAYREFRGPIPDGMAVCHRCDNPSCVRPSHLFLGSQEDNIADMVAKGRQRSPRGPRLDVSGAARGDRHGSKTKPGRVARGSRVNTSKLDEPRVRQIRAMAGRGHSFASMARAFGVTSVSIAAIVHRKTWRHLT